MKELKKKMNFSITKPNPSTNQLHLAVTRAFLGLAVRLAEVDGTTLEESLELACQYGERLPYTIVEEFAQVISQETQKNANKEKF
jgi:hypothetical protein